MIPAAPWRVVIVTRLLPVALGLHAVLRDEGHEPAALLTIRDPARRYGNVDTGTLLQGAPDDLDVLMPARRESLAPLLESVRPDLVACLGFPWRIPAEALAVPRLGWINGHPSFLPRHRGPVPVAWAIRKGEAEIGLTFHRMDETLDTGAILAQRSLEIGDYSDPDAFYGRMGPGMMDAFREALAKLAAGDPGTPQGEGGEYESFFTDEDAWLDLSRPREEVHRLVWAWQYAIGRGALRGALVDIDGETVRVLASSLDEVDGARPLRCADGPLWVVSSEPAAPTSA